MMTEATTTPIRVCKLVPFAPARPLLSETRPLHSGESILCGQRHTSLPRLSGGNRQVPTRRPLGHGTDHSRVHSGTTEPALQRPILSPEKLAAEGAPAEIQQVLGWTIDTHRLTVSLLVLWERYHLHSPTRYHWMVRCMSIWHGRVQHLGRAWRLLLAPSSPIFGESRVNNILEYIAMTINAIVSI